MSGLPMIHKREMPLRPTLSTSGTYNYKMSGFLVQLLAPLACDSFVVKDSFTFVEEICNFPNKNYVMASFDVLLLFTNITIGENCEIIRPRYRRYDGTIMFVQRRVNV